MTCRLLLVRHGETVDNVNKIMQGQTPGRLTLLGMEQARELGRQLRSEHIDVFLSSDLARAVETLRIIMEERPTPNPSRGEEPTPNPSRGEGCLNTFSMETVSSDANQALLPSGGVGGGFFPLEGSGLPLLRERDWGSFTGRYIPDLKDEVWPDDIETLEQMKARARRFLDYVREHYQGKTVLAVGHGIINKAIQSVYTGKPMNEIQKMANCEVRVLEL